MVDKRKLKYRNSFILAGAMTLLVSAFSFYTLLRAPTLLDSNELVFLIGTLKEKLVIDSDGKNHKSIDINLIEYPENLFNIRYSSYSSIPYPDELILNSHSGDSVIIGISKEDYKTKITKTQEPTLLSHLPSNIFVFTISINNVEYSSVDSYNQNNSADNELGKYALPIISAGFLVMTIYYRRKLANA